MANLLELGRTGGAKPMPENCSDSHGQYKPRSQYGVHRNLQMEVIENAYGHLFDDMSILHDFYGDLNRGEKGVAVFFMEHFSADAEGGGKIVKIFNNEDLQYSETECVEQFHYLLRQTCDNISQHITSLETMSKYRMEGDEIEEFINFVAPGNLHEAVTALGLRRNEQKTVREAIFQGGMGYEVNTGRPLGHTGTSKANTQRHVSYTQLTKIEGKVSTNKSKMEAAALAFTDMIAGKEGKIKPMNTASITEGLNEVTEALGWGQDVSATRVMRRTFNSFRTSEKSTGGGMSMPDALDEKPEGTSDMLKVPSPADMEEANMEHCRALYGKAEVFSDSHPDLLPLEDAAKDAEIVYLWNIMNLKLANVMYLALTMSNGLAKRLKGTRLITKVTELAAKICGMIDQEKENVNTKKHHGLYFIDWDSLAAEQLAVVIQLSASSLALGVFGEIMVGLNRMSAGNIKVEISNFVTDLRLLRLLRNHTMHTVISNLALQIRAINKDRRNSERLFTHPRILQLALENFISSHVKELTERSDYTETKELLIAPVEELNEMQAELNGKTYKVTQVDRFIAMLLKDKQGTDGMPWDKPSETMAAMTASNPNCYKDIKFLADIARHGHESSKFKTETIGETGPIPVIRGATPNDLVARATKGNSVAHLAAGFGITDEDAASSSKPKAKANAADGTDGHNGTPTKTEPSGPFSVGSNGYDDKSRSNARSRYAKMTPKDLYKSITKDGAYSGPPILETFFTITGGRLVRTEVGGPAISAKAWEGQKSLPEDQRLIRDPKCTPNSWYLLWRARQLNRFHSTKRGIACISLEHDPQDAELVNDASYSSFKASWSSTKAGFKQKTTRSDTNSSNTPTANLSVEDIEAAAEKEADQLEFQEKVKARGKEKLEERRRAQAGSSSDGQSQATITERSGDGGP
jgi:hypothetical protein